MYKKYLPFLLAILLCPAAEAKVYIDVTSPQTQMLIAVQEFPGPGGREISEIIKDDLSFTGFFLPIESMAFIEAPEERFDSRNWSVLGAQAVIKGRVEMEGEKLAATVYLYEVFEGRSILSKKYRAGRSGLRPLAHTVSNDIYREMTGEPGIFRTRVAFVSDKEGARELSLMDWDGGRARGLGIKADAILTPHWSEDSGKLLYSAQRKKQWVVYVLDFLPMKERAVLSTGGTDIAGDFFPGGKRFALSSSRAGTPDIYVYDLNSSKLAPVTSDAGIEVSPAVSPDGKLIAFVSDRGGSPQIYTMDGIGYNKTRITFEGSYNTSPSWSPKGDVLTFSGRYEGQNQIFVIRPDGSGLKVLTEEGNNEDPSFSPDGRYIVFTSDRGGAKGIYIMRADGSGQKRITPSRTKASGPRWSK